MRQLCGRIIHWTNCMLVYTHNSYYTLVYYRNLIQVINQSLPLQWYNSQAQVCKQSHMRKYTTKLTCMHMHKRIYYKICILCIICINMYCTHMYYCRIIYYRYYSCVSPTNNSYNNYSYFLSSNCSTLSTKRAITSSILCLSLSALS